jgi:hypothetical protein
VISFNIKAHTTAMKIHGEPYRFELPIFSETLPGQRRGLYISVENYHDRDEKAYLFIGELTVDLLMKGWKDRMSGEGTVLDFARQNVQEFKRLALNTKPSDLRWDGKAKHLIFDGETCAIYELEHPGDE